MAYAYPSSGRYTFDTQTGGDEDNFDWVDQTGTTNALQNSNSAGRWCWEDANTTSNNVGPDHGQGGDPDGYAYTEMSSQVSGDLWEVEFITAIDTTKNSLNFDFYWCMRGDSVRATIAVQTKEGVGGTWVTQFTTGYGDETIPGTSGATTWFNKNYNITDDGADPPSHASTYVRLHIVATADPTSEMWHNDIGIDGIRIFGDSLGGSYDQTSFRGKNDSGGETSTDWIAAANTDWDQVQDENFRVRFLIQEDDDVAEADVSFQLQYNRNSGGWNNVTGSSSVVRSSAGGLTEGGNTTQQIGSGTFVTPNAGQDETDGLAGGASLDFTTTVNQEVELEFCCQIRGVDTTRGDTIDLRVIKDSNPLAVYTSTPTLTIPTGAGMQLATAQFLQATAGAEDPGVFDFDRALPWGAITMALRRTSGGSTALAPTAKFDTVKTTGTVTVQDGATIDGLTFDSDVDLADLLDLDGVVVTGALDMATAGTYDFEDCDIGEVTNSSGGAITINALGSTVISTNTGPNITINRPVTVAVLVKDAKTGSVVAGARVYLETSPGGTEILNALSNASGIASTTWNYTSDQAVAGRVRRGTTTPLYKTAGLGGAIVSTGYSRTVFMVDDE